MKQRKISIDVLRGVALLGILTMNIVSFAMPDAAYFNPLAYGEGQFNYLIFLFSHVFFDQKFMALFSILFGASVILMTSKLERSGKRAWLNHFVRNGWLVVFGLLHGMYIWSGDILLVYAMLAFPLYFLRKLPTVILLMAGFVIYLVPSVFSVLEQSQLVYYDQLSKQTLADVWKPSPASIERDLNIFRGDYSQQLAERIGDDSDQINDGWGLVFITVLVDAFCRALGMMLIGMALYRTGVLTADKSKEFYLRMLWIGLAVGLPLVIAGVVLSIEYQWHWRYGLMIGRVPNNIATPFIAMAYLAAVMLWCQSQSFDQMKNKLAAVGQMALTNYIGQSLLATSIFYGFGLGWYGSLSRWQLLIVIGMIWLFQIFSSSWWLNRFRYGPLEWLWRSLTKFKLQPMMK